MAWIYATPLFVINYIFAITVRIKAANICTTWGHEKKTEKQYIYINQIKELAGGMYDVCIQVRVN